MTFVQRFGGLVNLNVHFHLVVPDGVFRRFIEPLLARAEPCGLGHLSEICEGEAPHRAVGCPFQAWSVAEALRLSST